MTVLLIGAAGFVGAIARYGVDVAFGDRSSTGFPMSTFVVNVSGSFVVGLLATLFAERFVDDEQLRLMLTVGFLGAFTTFSTYAYQGVRMLQEGAPAMSAAYLLGSLIAGVLAAVAGIALGRAFT